MTSSPGDQDGGGNCRVQLNQILAIIVRKEGCHGDPGDFWMYENGYLLFQGLLSSNSVCWWNNALNGATKGLIYYGYVNPGALLVGSEPCALEVLRNAWAKRVLQPPPGYQIVALEDIEYCNAQSVGQTQWTPLPEAVCTVVLRLSSQGRPAGIATIREALIIAFPHVSPPSEQALYDTLVQLTKERKLYNTSSGYFIITPEKKRSRSQSRSRNQKESENCLEYSPNKSMLMSTEEAMAMVHGDMATIRDGNVTHQCVQTNLADVICGGNSSDKILYPRNKRRSASFPAPRSPDRKGSFRLWGSARRLRRSASTRTIHKHYADTSSSTEYPNSGNSTPTLKKESLFSKIFRRSKRSQCQVETFNSQFPPTEWFNSKTIHLHSVGTQTSTEKDSGIDIVAYLENINFSSGIATLPRRHRRHLCSDATLKSTHVDSRDPSPVSKNIQQSYVFNSIPRRHGYRSRESFKKSSSGSLAKPPTVLDSKLGENSVEKPNKEELNQSEERLSPMPISASQRYHASFEYDASSEVISPAPVKHIAGIDNSGPSSIESHKSSKTGSSLTSGPSSLESHKTVINRNLDSKNLDSKSPRKERRDKESPKLSLLPQKPTSMTSTSMLTSSNSFTLQVTTKNGGVNLDNTNATATATINTGSSGNNTKIFVQNSPVRSVITFENGQSDNPNIVIVNGESENKNIEDVESKPVKNTNRDSQISLNNTKEEPNTEAWNEMNNSRKLSLQHSTKDNLNFHNLIKNVSANTNNQYISCSNPDSPIANHFRELSKNTVYNSTPPSPTKSYEGLPLEKYLKKDIIATNTLQKFCSSEDCKVLDKNTIGSDSNISNKDRRITRESRKQQFPSLSDLSFNFTSLAAQKILKGVSINSVDTLVELNMANNPEKQNNCEIVHTDFGII